MSYYYTAREWDDETGLYYYRARYYDPEVGRFLSEDPLGFATGANFYTYAGNNSPNFVDPLGLRECGETDEDCGADLLEYALDRFGITPYLATTPQRSHGTTFKVVWTDKDAAKRHLRDNFDFTVTLTGKSGNLFRLFSSGVSYRHRENPSFNPKFYWGKKAGSIDFDYYAFGLDVVSSWRHWGEVHDNRGGRKATDPCNVRDLLRAAGHLR